MTQLGTSSGYLRGSNSQKLGSAAVDSAVDAYATKLLRRKSPPEACIDENLGPYITSLIRGSASTDRVQDIPDFESVIELLEEHCGITADVAVTVLSTIVKAVRTGVVAEERTAYKSLLMDGTQFLSSEIGNALVNPQASDEYQSAPFRTIETASEQQPDKLIPIDLMGLIDDPSIPVAKDMRNRIEFHVSEPEAFPPLGTAAPSLGTSKKTGKPPRNSTKDEGGLASALFHSRPRQVSIDEYHPRSRQPSVDAEDAYASSYSNQVLVPEDLGYRSDAYEYCHQQQLDSAIDFLLSMNSDLSHDAAHQAVILACLDSNVAQYVVAGALSAPPICRHMMSGGCYRSDCQFSHDVDGHTCLFWLRGRCGKGDSCKFRHGFSEGLLDGFGSETSNVDEPSVVHSHSNPVGIPTKNLVSHNAMGLPHAASCGSSWAHGGYSPGGHSLQSWETTDHNGMASLSLDEHHSKEGFSFASIVSKGHKTDSFSAKTAASQTNSSVPSSRQKAVKIPQDLWSHHMNRNAAAFRIQDPMERYKEVAKSVLRDDVIDLHFQSIKTFPLVLPGILEQKLRAHDEVWVVTGSGHHVARDSHQKGGGALEAAVMTWLEEQGYHFVRGRDRNGHCGALLIRGR